MLLTLLLFVQAASTPAADPASAAKAAPPAEKLICHYEQLGESRIAQKICHTKAEWEQLERQSQDDFSSNMNKQNNPGNSPE
ncbi:MAG TPA: hypothetical protein VF098_05095 [Sphingomicrobium sp.]|jgi:predicted secreted protein